MMQKTCGFRLGQENRRLPTVQARIAALALDNPGMTAYAITRPVGCDVKITQKYWPA